MEMIEVVTPSLTEYMAKVRFFASQYLDDADLWYKLREADLADEDDRDEFSFIRMAVWDKLMEREFYPFLSPPGQVGLFSQGDIAEPEMISGSFICGGADWAHINTQRSLIGCSIALSI